MIFSLGLAFIVRTFGRWARNESLGRPFVTASLFLGASAIQLLSVL